MNAHKRMKHPPGGWILHMFPLWIRKRRVRPLKRLTNAGLQGRLHQPTHGHDHQENHDPPGFFEVARGGQQLGIFHEANPVLPMRLAVVAFQQLLRGQWSGVACVGGQDDTTVLVDAGLSGRTRGGQGPRALGAQLSGLHALSGASPRAIAGRHAHGARPQNRGLPVLREGGKRLTRIGFARNGDAASLLQGVDCLVTLLAQLLVNGALCSSLAGLGVDEAPALLHAAVGRGQLVSAIALLKRYHGLWIGLSQGGLGVAHGCRAGHG
jgi:hypothetical protein